MADPMPKGEPEDMGDEEYSSASSMLFDEYADDVFAALKKDDKAGFRSALKSAIGACSSEE